MSDICNVLLMILLNRNKLLLLLLLLLKTYNSGIQILDSLSSLFKNAVLR